MCYINRTPIIFFLISLMLCFAGCSTAKVYTGTSSMHLKDNEGIVVFRIHNPHAGMEGWYFKKSFGNNWGAEHLLSLHSDILLATPGRLYSVENKQQDQIVCIVLPKGEYIVDKIGRHSWFDSEKKMYKFTVQPNKINYAGDFYLNLYLGEPSREFLPILTDIDKGLDTSLYDWYSLEVRDSWEETSSLVYSQFPDLLTYPVVSEVSYREEVMPTYCWGERAEVRMGTKQPIYQKDGIWYFTLEPL